MPKRVDSNQADIVKALRACGYSVAVTSDLGKGFPDIAVGGIDPTTNERRNWLFEIKNPEYGCKLTRKEAEWHLAWRGQAAIVTTVEDALGFLRG